MKHFQYVLLVILMLVAGFSADAQWERVMGPFDDQNGEFTLTGKNGIEIYTNYRTGDTYISSDHGASWLLTPHPYCGACESVTDADADTIFSTKSLFVANDRSQFSVSYDRGVHWGPVWIGNALNYNDIRGVFAKSGVWYVWGENRLISSNNAGQTWQTELVTQVNENIYPAFREGQYLYAMTGNRFMRKTLGVPGWTDILTNPQYLIGQDIIAKGDTLIVPCLQHMRRSFDAGNSFTDIQAVEIVFLQDRLVTDGSYSEDWGDNWVNFPSVYGIQDLSSDGYALFADVNDFGDSIKVTEDFGQHWTSLNNNFIQIDAAAICRKGDSLMVLSNFHNKFFLSDTTFQEWKISDASYTNMIQVGQYYYAVSLFNNISRSADQGATWTVVNPDAEGNTLLYGVDSLIWCYGNNLLFSNDYGITWQSFASSAGEIAFFQDKLYSVSVNDLYYSDDYGENWNIMQTPDNELANSVAADPGKIYVSTTAGFYHSTDGANWQVSINGIVPEFWTFPALLLKNTEHYLLSYQGLFAYIYDKAGDMWFTTSSPFGTIQYDYFTDAIEFGPYLYFSAINSGIRRYPINQLHFDSLLAATDTISGFVYEDLNNNGIREGGESGIAGAMVYLDNPYSIASADSTGYYQVLYVNPDPNVNHLLHPAYPNLYAQINPATRNVSGTMANQNFGIHSPPGINDLSVVTYGGWPTVPGFTRSHSIYARNHGTTNQNATIKFYPDPDFTLVSTNPAPDFIVNDTLVWNEFLASGETRYFSANYTISPNAPIGANLQTQAWISPVVSDYEPIDNTSVNNITVVGAYDPNDKAVSPTTFTTDNLAAGDSLHYTIRFQNVGNYFAQNVRILDTLDADLDPATFRFVASSHSCRWEMRGAGIVEFFFDNIFLPDSGLNEVNSHGFVQYSVEPRAGTVLGDTITNTAHIFFDFNAPITTNTVENQVESPVFVIQAPQVPEALELWPNPTDGQFFVTVPDGFQRGRLLLYDALGKVVLSRQLDVVNRAISVNAPAVKGIYTCVLVSLDGKRWAGNVVRW